MEKSENTIVKKYSSKLMDAMKEHKEVAKEVYKLIKSKLMEFQTQKNAPELTESVEIQILNKMLKELNDERENNVKVNNTARVAELDGQIAVVKSELPLSASEEDIINALDEYIAKNGQYTQKEMGTVMTYLKSKFTNMDGKTASALVRSKF